MNFYVDDFGQNLFAALSPEQKILLLRKSRDRLEAAGVSGFDELERAIIEALKSIDISDKAFSNKIKLFLFQLPD